jgi:alpha-L-arabinofuranosidase
VNVIGCIKATATSADFATTALPLILYRKHFETVPVRVSHSIPLLDVSAAVSEDGVILTLAMVNSSDQPTVFQLNADEMSIPRNARSWMIHHEDPEAFNVPGEVPEVTIVESEYTLKNNKIEVPGYAIMLLEFNKSTD